MDSTVTVADVRTSFARFGLSASDFLYRLNRATQFLLNSDVFTDVFTKVSFASSNGTITIPRHFGRAYGVWDDGLAKPLFAPGVQWVAYGVGRQDPSQMCLDGLIDLGNHYVTQADLLDSDGNQVEGTLRLKIANATDAAKVLHIDGTFTDSASIVPTQPRFNLTTGVQGIDLTTVNPSADTTLTFLDVTGLQFPTMVGRSSLWKVVAGVETQIGAYEPGETRPRYVRYRTRETTTSIGCYCRRQFVTLISDTDWVEPGNLTALEHAFDAQSYRDRGDFKTEAECWNLAKQVLRDEYAGFTVGVTTMMSSDNFGWPGPGWGGGVWGR